MQYKGSNTYKTFNYSELDNRWYIEASAKMEEIMKSAGAPVVRDEKKILAILGNEKKPEFIGDGYYTRSLSKVDKRITKRIYGKPR